MFCFCNELFFVCMYLNAFIQTPISSVVLPELVVKTGLDKIAPCLLRGAANLTWPQFVAALNFPLCAGKQIINVVQFWKASKIVSEPKERGNLLTKHSSSASTLLTARRPAPRRPLRRRSRPPRGLPSSRCPLGSS